MSEEKNTVYTFKEINTGRVSKFDAGPNIDPTNITLFNLANTISVEEGIPLGCVKLVYPGAIREEDPTFSTYNKIITE